MFSSAERRVSAITGPAEGCLAAGDLKPVGDNLRDTLRQISNFASALT
jgi:hypothetical protein